jgi:hypothetical protein
VLTLLLGTTGGAAATIRYDRRHSDTLLDGVRIGGVDVGGLAVSEARDLLFETFDESLDRPITLIIDRKSHAVTPRSLGVSVDWAGPLRRAEAIATAIPLWKRVWMRATATPVKRKLDVFPSVAEDKMKGFVDQLATQVNRPPQDASVALQGDRLAITPEVDGFELDREVAFARLSEAISEGKTTATLRGNRVVAAIPEDRFDDMLVVKVGDNKLLHYRFGQVVKTYDVATGEPGYPTPLGLRFVIRKRSNPTWYNPAKYPGGWGWSLPRSIPPGPGNPLGSRVLDMGGTLARIHATSALYSIGYNASHGCIRMRPSEIEQLFEQVEIGTPVLIVRTGAYRFVPAPQRPAQPATPQPEAESDAGATPAAAPAG